VGLRPPGSRWLTGVEQGDVELVESGEYIVLARRTLALQCDGPRHSANRKAPRKKE